MVNTLNNRNMYRCSFAHTGVNRCTSTPCAPAADSKTFVTSSYWADQRIYEFYDTALDQCADGHLSSAPTQTQIDCRINRCRELCYEAWGSNCVSYTYYYPSWTMGTQDFCYTYGMDCLVSDHVPLTPHPAGFNEKMASVQSYGEVYREYHASSYFCHQYSRRALHEEEQAPTERPSSRRSLWSMLTGTYATTKTTPKEDLNYKAVTTGFAEMGANFTHGGHPITNARVKTYEDRASDDVYAYGTHSTD
jgi:hypothetical protein